MDTIGLDPSLTSFGWAIYTAGANTCLRSGVFKTRSTDLFVLRNKYMRESIEEVISESSIKFIAIEYPVFKETYSEGMYGLFLFSCEALYNAGVNVVFFDNSQVKAYSKRILNRPSGWLMNKSDIKEAIEVLMSIKRTSWKTSDESDALMIAYMGHRFWSHMFDDDFEFFNKYEEKLFTEVKKHKDGSEKKRGIALRENERFFIWDRGS